MMYSRFAAPFLSLARLSGWAQKLGRQRNRIGRGLGPAEERITRINGLFRSLPAANPLAQ